MTVDWMIKNDMVEYRYVAGREGWSESFSVCAIEKLRAESKHWITPPPEAKSI